MIHGKEILVFFIFLFFNGSVILAQKDSLSFLALGDSYTVGTSEKQEHSWPVQLVDLLSTKGVVFKSPEIIAGAGWTTEKLISELQSAKPSSDYDLVSLLIGVNNQYRGKNINQFRKEFILLLEKSISLANNETSRVFVLSIPDWSVMPFAGLKDKEKISLEIKKYNTIIKEEAANRNVLFIDITKLSRQALVNNTLIAEDGLHPSKKMYKTWVKKISKKLLKMFE